MRHAALHAALRFRCSRADLCGRRRLTPWPGRLVPARAALAAACALATVLVAAVPGAPLAAAAGSWSSLGPDGGPVAAVAVAPSNPRVVYAGASHGGVFKSADGGITWAAAGRGLLDDRMVALAVDPQDPSAVYAAAFTGVYVSGDGGDSWSSTSLSLPDDGQDNLVSLALDPTLPGTAYAGTVSDVWKSSDGGHTWHSVFAVGDGLDVHVIADVGRGLMLALVFRAEGFNLFASSNHGITWSNLSAGLPQPVVPKPNTGGLIGWQLAADPARAGPLYLAYDFALNTGIRPGPLTAAVTYRSIDAGHSWHVSGPGGYPLAAGPAHVVYAGGYRSGDGGRAWAPIAAPPDAVQVLAAGDSPDVIYAGAAHRGVLRSGDGGRTWQVGDAHLRAAAVTALAVDPADAAKLYAYANGEGLFVSRTGGGHWRGTPSAGVGVPSALGAVTLAIDPVATGTIYLGSQAGLEKSTDAGATWVQLQPQGGACFRVGSLAVDPSSPATLYATGEIASSCSSSGVFACSAFESRDGGISWSCLAVDLIRIVAAPSSPGTLYGLGPADATSGAQPLYRTTDGGATWAVVAGVLPGPPPAALTLLVDPTDAQRLFVATGGGEVWRSVDGGQHWSEMDGGLPAAGVQLLLAIDPLNPATIYAASSEIGVYRSIDAGSSWQPLLSGLPPLHGPPTSGELYNQLVADPMHSGTVYLATDSNGVLSYTAP
jgi:photosystem II stability/assembly factor-like uncharacterized protein